MPRTTLTMIWMLGGAVAAAGLAAADGPSFTGLGALPGHDSSQAAAVSGDGAFVAGRSGVWTCMYGTCWIAGEIGFRYDVANGVLDSLVPEFDPFRPAAISLDGSVIVGSSGFEAVRWEAGQGFTALGVLAGYAWSDAFAVSADGHTVAGTCTGPWTMGCCSSEYRPVMAFAWTESLGMTPLLVEPPNDESAALAITADGAALAGYGHRKVCDCGWGCCWISTAAMQDIDSGEIIDLGALLGYDHSEAHVVSADGTTVIGVGDGGTFRWTVAGTVEELVDIPGSEWTTPIATSADGSIVVGAGVGPVALIWDLEHGTRILQDVLEENPGLDLTGWSLTEGTGISYDGRTIIGTGTNPDGRPEGWIADLGYVTSPGDIDGDGMVDVTDLLLLLVAWGPCAECLSCPADIDGDCVVDVADLLILLSNWT